MKKFIFLLLIIITFIGCSKVNEKMKTATIETDKGIIKLELYEKETPITVENFVELAQSGFYDGLIFHRVEPGFVIQGGDPNGDGTGGSEKSIQLEIPCEDGSTTIGKITNCKPKVTHTKGALAMARTPDPNSATSQFYITLAPTPMLDGKYAVFGKVIEGMDIVKQIRVGDKMTKVSISNG